MNDGICPAKPTSAEEQRRVRQAVDQPRLRHLLHPRPDQRDQLAAEEEPEVAVTECAEGLVTCSRRGRAMRAPGHCRLLVVSS